MAEIDYDPIPHRQVQITMGGIQSAHTGWIGCYANPKLPGLDTNQTQL